MNESEAIKRDGELPLYDAVKDLTEDKLESIVRKNAAEKNFAVKDEHIKVIHTLVEHYKKTCQTEDCLAAHEHMRFLKMNMPTKGAANIYICFSTPYLIARAYSPLSMN